jgi:L-methionine (R)-S-oxide reductase
MPVELLLDQIKTLVESNIGREEVLQKAAELLQKQFPKFDWVGFYIMEGDELVLGPYVGKPSPHTRIKLDTGICGAAAREQKTVIVDDVNSDPRYLACSLETKSEIVVPIWKGEKIVGEIDIDSNELQAFDLKDQQLLEKISVALSNVF